MKWLAVFVVLFAPVAGAATFTEDFEDFSIVGLNPDVKPDSDWYDYNEGEDVGNVTAEAPIPEGSQAFRFSSGTDVDISTRRATFSLEVPIQLVSTSFSIVGTPKADDSRGSIQFVSIESSAPVRKAIEFFVVCTNATFTEGCEFRVRWLQVDSIGQVLVPASENLTQFDVMVVFDWIEAEVCLFVNGVDDGCFPMLNLPVDVGRLRFGQYRSDIPWLSTFDNWTVVGASNETDELDADIATGLKNFGTNTRFTSAGSLFVFGLVWFLILSAAVIVPVVSVGRSNALVPGLAFYEILLVLWLVFMEWWPDWIGILVIILGATIISLALRKYALGIGRATNNAGIAITCLGYFIIVSTFLAFSGYAGETISVPSGPPSVADSSGTQSFGEAVVECTVGIISFGILGDCNQETTSSGFAKLNEAIDGIFSVFYWAVAGIKFLFQLLTFQLPIPVVFNMMIVLPPAVGLVVVAVSIARGAG